MADGLNQKINDHDSISTILSSDNFLNLDTNIQNRIIDTVHTDKEKDGGTMGKFLGTNSSNAAMHIALIICGLLLLIIIIDMFHSYYINSNINMELINLIIPVVTLSLGYIFRKRKSNLILGIKKVSRYTLRAGKSAVYAASRLSVLSLCNPF